MKGPQLRRVLLVEDEPDIQAITRMALEVVGGMEVCVCSGGREALDQAPRFKPDLILLDVMMPGMTGPETLRELRSNVQTASIPVIFMTAKVQPNEVQEYRALGALQVVAKPFDPMTLPETVSLEWEKYCLAHPAALP